MYSSIGMMNKVFNIFSLIQGLIQSSYTAFKFQAVADIVAYYFAAVHICNEWEVTKSLYGSDVGDIAYPDLVGPGDRYIFDDVPVLIEPVQRVGGSGSVFLSERKHIVFSKNVEQGVPAYF